MLPGRFPDGWLAVAVSILTGPGGPVLPPPCPGGSRTPTSFNPHRARRPGATCQSNGSSSGPVLVSILTGPGGPVLLQARERERERP